MSLKLYTAQPQLVSAFSLQVLKILFCLELNEDNILTSVTASLDDTISMDNTNPLITPEKVVGYKRYFLKELEAMIDYVFW